jgi:hypothetical protein
VSVVDLHSFPDQLSIEQALSDVLFNLVRVELLQDAGFEILFYFPVLGVA